MGYNYASSQEIGYQKNIDTLKDCVTVSCRTNHDIVCVAGTEKGAEKGEKLFESVSRFALRASLLRIITPFPSSFGARSRRLITT